ncbi:MAG TPA: dihydrodipicolinate synthase family protein [Opitutaceae bacterium]|nr:dihydrodipicolinate synthase family protein [Opitutaceae bacterium]
MNRSPDSPRPLPRREFLQVLGAGALGLALAARQARAQAPAAAPGGKQLRGVFPIAETPFTPDDKLDTDSLAAQVTFCNKGGVHGLMWPQLASGWSTMDEAERMTGAEAILAAGKGGTTALVIGVQGKDLAQVGRFAQHAAAHGADAIISLPPGGVTDEKQLLDYYQQVGKITDLPLFAQCVGSMSVDLVVQMQQTIPTLKGVKDEAGVPLQRVGELRRRTHDQLRIFAGQGVRTMIAEMELGFSGHCPYTGLGDVYAAAFDLFHAGRKREAFDMFGRILAFDSLGGMDQNHLLISRGVFKPDAHFRKPSAAGGVAAGGGGGGGRRPGLTLDDGEVTSDLHTYLEPWLKA